MIEHKLFIMRGEFRLLAFGRTVLQSPIHDRHRHGFAFIVSKGQAIPARITRRFLALRLGIGNHLTFGGHDLANRNREAEFFRNEFNIDFADADLAAQRVRTPPTALRRISQR